MQAELAALVGSRICHDLISPIGAIQNGVELMALTGGSGGEEMALIKQSVETAAARIKFFRIAYGGAEPGQLVSPKEVISILRPLSLSGRIDMQWSLEGEQSRLVVRSLFLLLQALESALPLGGTITITGAEHEFRLTATGRRISYDETLWGALSVEKLRPSTSAALVHFALLPEALAAASLKATVLASETGIVVRLYGRTVPSPVTRYLKLVS